MKFLPMSRALMAGALLIAPSLARADVIYETAYVPTSSVLLPTSTVLSTSVVTPTSYTSYLTPTVSRTYLTPTSTIVSPDDVLFPTSYVSTYRTVRRPRRYVERTSYYVAPRYALAPTSYVLPTSYVTPTTYLAPTSYVTSSIVPTTYLAPTSYVTSSIVPTSYLLDTSLVATSASSTSECGTFATTPMPTSRAAAPAPASNPAPSNERRPSAVMESSPSNVDNEPSPVNPPVPPPAANPPVRATKPAPAPSDVPAAAPEPGPLDPGPTPPAQTPLSLPEPGSIERQGDAPRTDAGAGPDFQTRETRRPIYSTPNSNEIRPFSRARNVLRGRVVSYDNGKAEEGVTVYLTSRTGAFSERTTMTDAYGNFAVTLPDGDWAVKVKMPSGNIMPVGREDVTASAGRIMDSAGRGVQEFVITR